MLELMGGRRASLPNPQTAGILLYSTKVSTMGRVTPPGNPVRPEGVALACARSHKPLLERGRW